MNLTAAFRRRRNVYEIAARQRDLLLRAESAAVRRILRLYRVTDAEVRRRLASIGDLVAETRAAIDAAAINAGALNEEQLRREVATLLSDSRRYRMLQTQVEAQMTLYQAAVGQEIAEQQLRSMALGIAHAAQLAEGVGLRALFTELPIAAIEGMAGQTVTGAPLGDLLLQIGRSAKREIEQQLVTGIALGDNPRVVGKRIAARVGAISKARAITIARNESVRVYTMAQARSYEANSDVITEGRVISARDGRTCAMCWAQDGTSVPLGTDIYRHVACRCAIIPVPRYGGLPDRRTGVQEFDLLDEQEQLQILGPGRLELYQQGVPLQDMYRLDTGGEWGNTLRLIPLRDLVA
jgi:SPP1 gp7 family putative phage head morphogenesis protein